MTEQELLTIMAWVKVVFLVLFAIGVTLAIFVAFGDDSSVPAEAPAVTSQAS